MGQRLFKTISCIVLMVSVFFCFFFVALADDSVSTPQNWDGGFWIYANDFMMADFAAPNNLNGSTAYTGKFSGSTNVVIKLSSLQQGCVYTGLAWMEPSWTRQYFDSTAIYSQANVYCTDVQAPEGVTVSFMDYDDADGPSSFRLRINVYFDNYYHTPKESELHISFVLHIEQGVTTTSGGSISPYFWIHNPSDHDYSGTVTFQQLQADPNISDVYYMGEQQMQQQQQIANQQSQQSEQQHNSLINGYDNAANDTMLADKNSVLQGFEQQQDQAISDGQQYVSDFSANYDTAPLVAMAPAFMMISTWFNDLWGGMGNFSTVLIVGLMLCVAGYILKLKH